MLKSEIFLREKEKLNELFEDVEPTKAKLVEGLIEDAAFLYAENAILRELINDTGMVKVHPSNKDLQKSTEAAKQFLKNINSYAVLIKTLNGILSKNVIEDDDGLDEFE